MKYVKRIECTEYEMADDSEVEVTSLSGCVGSSGGLVRTFLVFLKLPKHVEFRVGDMPILNKGTVLEIDVSIFNPKFRERTVRIRGPHLIERSRLVLSNSKPGLMGLTQYFELSPCDVNMI